MYKRWAHLTSGRAVWLSAVGATGAVLLLSGIAAARSVLTQMWLPPWAVVALFVLAAAVAIAGMVVVETLLPWGRVGRGPCADTAITPAAGAERRPAPGMPQGVSSRELPLERFQVDTAGGKRIIAAEAVEWLEACANYARLHLPDESFLYRMPLSQLQDELDPRHFLRVHRSVIVNLDAIRRVDTRPSGDATIWLSSGASVRMSRRYAPTFHARTGRGH